MDDSIMAVCWKPALNTDGKRNTVLLEIIMLADEFLQRQKLPTEVTALRRPVPRAALLQFVRTFAKSF